MVKAAPSFGVVFPTANADVQDFVSLLGRAVPQATLGVVELSWADGKHSELGRMSDDALAASVSELGDPAAIAEALTGSTDRFDAVALAVTSSTFMRSISDHDRQLSTMQATARCAATSTMRAFQDAVTRLGASVVSIASVYPPHFTDRFIEHIRQTGATVVHRVDANARTDLDLAHWGDARILDLVAGAAHPEAQVILLPETALHTDHLTAALTEVAGVPVLTATQVTIWSLFRSIGQIPTADDAGPLFSG